MTNERFKNLHAYLLFASGMAEKVENGERDIQDKYVQNYLEFEIGCALVEFLRVTGKNPSETLVWINEEANKLEIKHSTNRTNNRNISNLINDMGYEGYGIFWTLMELMPVYGFSIPCCYHALGERMNADPDKVKKVAEEYGLFSVEANHYGSEMTAIRPTPENGLFMEYMRRENERWRVANERFELEKLENQTVKQSYRQENK